MDKEQKSWDLETGLPSDIDAWIGNPRFGVKDEYAQAVQATGAEGGIMFIVDLLDEKSELLGSQGWSIGTGWIVSDDGLEISHPKRKNVVNSSMYGRLQARVVKDLKVDMESRGLPTQAKSWAGLGFHWMQEPHPTVSGEEKTGLMPTEVLAGKAAAPAAVAVEPTAIESELIKLVKSAPDAKAFQVAALRIEGVVTNDDLMARVLDEGPAGFYATNKG